jgi:hypothetical protein
MSTLTPSPRPPAPSQRPSPSRSDALFLVACDDTYAPQQYLDFLRLSFVQVEVIPTPQGEGTSTLEAALLRLQRQLPNPLYPQDERWLVCDTDHRTRNPNHCRGFAQALQEAKRAGIHVALSRPCFELWLLFHHERPETLAGLGTAREVEDKLRAVLGEYSKTNLKVEHYPLSGVRDAVQRAAAWDPNVPGGDIPEANTSRVYRLLRALVHRARAGQLPQELLALRQETIEAPSR